MGMGSFQPQHTIQQGKFPPRYVDGADFDGDGDFDLCTPDYIGMTTTVLENDGNGVFFDTSPIPHENTCILMGG